MSSAHGRFSYCVRSRAIHGSNQLKSKPAGQDQGFALRDPADHVAQWRLQNDCCWFCQPGCRCAGGEITIEAKLRVLAGAKVLCCLPLRTRALLMFDRRRVVKLYSISHGKVEDFSTMLLPLEH